MVAEHYSDLVLGLGDPALLLRLLVHVLLREGEQVLNGLNVVLVLNADLAQEQEIVVELTDVLPLGGERCGGS